MRELQPQVAPKSIRRDGWTSRRQLAFLDTLARTLSVTAARSAGMSRMSAYRLRARDPRGLFAAAWDRAFEGYRRVNLVPRPKARQAFGLPRFSLEGYEVHDPRFSLTPRSKS